MTVDNLPGSTDPNQPTLQIQATVGSADFGALYQGTKSSPHVFRIENSGPTAATGCSSPWISNPGDFEIVSSTCTTSTMDVGAECTVTVVGRPSNTGTRTGQLRRQCNETMGSIDLVETASAPIISITPTVYDFSPLVPTTVGSQTAVSQEFVVTNNSATATASGCGWSFGGTNPGDFYSDQSDSRTTCSGVRSLAPGASCKILVYGMPTLAMTLNATLLFHCQTGGLAATVPNGLQVIGSGANLSFSPPSFDFGTVTSGTPTQLLRISNSGTADATNCNLNLASVDFTLNPSPAGGCGTGFTLNQSGGFCDFEVSANLSSPGVKRSTVSISCDGGIFRHLPVQMQRPGEAVEFDQSYYNFDSFFVGATDLPEKGVILINTGTTAVECGTLTVTGPYTAPVDTCSGTRLDPGAKCLLTLKPDSPVSIGSNPGVLNIACGATTASANMMLNGVTPAVSASPSSWGPSLPTNSSTMVVISVTNNSSVALTGCSGGVSGPPSYSGNPYGSTEPCTPGLTLGAGKSCQYQVGVTTSGITGGTILSGNFMFSCSEAPSALNVPLSVTVF